MQSPGTMILLGIGANLPRAHAAPPLAACRAAVAALRVLPGYTVQSVSPWYETAPIPPSGQPPYVNGAARLDGPVEPDRLLTELQAIEAAFGRVRTVANAARPLDLDIIAIGDLIRTRPDPVLPHPRAHRRAFVLRPLADVAPGSIHPVLGETVEMLLRCVADQQFGYSPVTERFERNTRPSKGRPITPPLPRLGLAGPSCGWQERAVMSWVANTAADDVALRGPAWFGPAATWLDRVALIAALLTPVFLMHGHAIADGHDRPRRCLLSRALRAGAELGVGAERLGAAWPCLVGVARHLLAAPARARCRGRPHRLGHSSGRHDSLLLFAAALQ